MKIAVPTREDLVDAHFGHCEYYTVFDIDEHKTVKGTEVLPSPQGCGCKSNVAEILQQKGVSVMLAGNMGGGALAVLNNHGIKVYRGCTGNVHQLIKAFMDGDVLDSGVSCSHHGNHTCNH